MNKKDKLIIGLIAIGIILFVVIQLVIIPTNQKKQAEYKLNQTDSLTHDITVVENYKSQYVGDSSNIINLFYTLPLNNISMKFQINSDDCSLTVNYLNTVENIGKEKVHRDLIYNTVASMAAIWIYVNILDKKNRTINQLFF